MPPLTPPVSRVFSTAPARYCYHFSGAEEMPSFQMLIASSFASHQNDDEEREYNETGEARC